MFRYVFTLTFAAGFAAAATISTSATCDGVTTVGTASATCNDGRFSATATVSSTHASVFALPSDPTGSGGASASFSTDYVFTVPGMSGGGLFFPCFSSSGSPNATGEGSLGGITIPLGFPNCPSGGIPVVPFPLPTFTLGVPQIVHFSIEAAGTGSAASHLIGSADVSFHGILLFDPSLCPRFGCDPGDLPQVFYLYTLVEVPEPSTLSILGVGLMFLLAVRLYLSFPILNIAFTTHLPSQLTPDALIDSLADPGQKLPSAHVAIRHSAKYF
jgi:hypothetical protein